MAIQNQPTHDNDVYLIWPLLLAMLQLGIEYSWRFVGAYLVTILLISSMDRFWGWVVFVQVALAVRYTTGLVYRAWKQETQVKRATNHDRN